MVIEFIPTWGTPAGLLASLVEDEVVSIPLHCAYVGYAPAVLGASLVEVGPRAREVVDLRDGSEVVRFIVDGANLAFVPRPRPGLLVLTIPGDQGFSLLNGALPPGLSLSSTGTISGTIADVPNGVTAYAFTVRCTSGTQVRDRAFTIDVTGIDHPASFDPDHLPGFVVDDRLDRPFRPLATVKLAQPFTYTFRIIDQDNALPAIRLRPLTGMANRPGVYAALPRGLVLDGQSITGTVAPDAIPGRYLFLIALDDPKAPSEELFELVVLPSVDDTIGIVPKIVWMTPAGAIGTLDEGDACYLGVRARAEGRPAPLLALSPSSPPLPPGLSLDVAGDIHGIVGFVGASRTFTVTVRAASGPMYVDRDFTIAVNARTRTPDPISVRLRLRSTERVALSALYREILPQARVFRPSDPQFGIARHPRIDVIAGLDRAAFTRVEPAAIPTSAYHGAIRLVLGAHRITVVRDVSGTPAYEVLYRDLHDPLALSGGFLFDSKSPVRDPVINPQTPTRTIVPQSLRNLRLDLVDRIGFAALDPALARIPGLDGGEILPAWMRSPQNQDEPASRLGFVPAMVIACLIPGSATGVMRLLARAASELPENGSVYVFDKLWLSNDRALQLSWEDNIDG